MERAGDPGSDYKDAEALLGRSGPKLPDPYAG